MLLATQQLQIAKIIHPVQQQVLLTTTTDSTTTVDNQNNSATDTALNQNNTTSTTTNQNTVSNSSAAASKSQTSNYLPRYTGQFEINFNKEEVKKILQQGKKDGEGVKGS